MKLKRDVVLLATNQRANLAFNQINSRLLYDVDSTIDGVLPSCTYQHLHITSDEKPVDGDWFIDTKTNKVHKCKRVDGNEIVTDELDLHEPFGDCHYYFTNTETKKIIATTDKSLGLPSPSDGFIKKFIERYNAVNPITEVMVEYEYESGYQTIDPILEMNPILKVDKNNCIAITAVKDSWTKDELDAVLNEFAVKCIKYALHGGLPSDAKAFTKSWIEQNL